jgi:serine/threonine protein phosphatase PrpC
VTKGIALALADGISTSRLGAAAAETAVKSFLTDYYCTSAAWSVRTAGERVIAATNSWMHAQNSRHRPREDGEDRERGALICTFSALVLKARAAHLFHVGDARIALIARGRVEPLTEPHRVELGGGESYLGRALGVNRAVEIDYRQVPLQPGDLFMLSTDGVHEFVGDAEVLALLEQAGDLPAAARSIAEAARANGSADNLTCSCYASTGLPNGEVAGPARRRARPSARAPGSRPATGSKAMRSCASCMRAAAAMSISRATRPTAARVALKVPATDPRPTEGELAALLLEEWVMQRVSHQNLLAAGARGAGPARACLRGRAVHRGTDARPVDGRPSAAGAAASARRSRSARRRGAGAAPARDAPPRPCGLGTC